MLAIERRHHRLVQLALDDRKDNRYEFILGGADFLVIHEQEAWRSTPGGNGRLLEA